MNFGNDHDRNEEDYENDDFDMRDDLDFEDDEDEGSMLRWVSVLFVLAAVGGFVALAWYAYQSGVQPVSEDEIPYVSAEETPVKEKPEEPGGWQFEHQDKAVYNQLAAGKEGQERPVAERLMPAPEEPVERPEVEQILPEDFEREEVNGNAVETPIPSTKENGKTEVVVVDAEPEPVASVAEEKVDEPVVAEAKTTAPEPVKAPEPTPAEKPAPAPVPAPAPTPAPAPVTSSASGQYMAQLGAFGSNEDAFAAWTKIDAAHGAMFPTKEHAVQRADLGAKGVFYRLQLGPFSNETSARKVCDYLQQNKQGCFVVKK